ncbi:MAG: ABC transporter permease [Clostridia bacterium]|nr:ABC transporter permease [Clostridia bacterium]
MIKRAGQYLIRHPKHTLILFLLFALLFSGSIIMLSIYRTTVLSINELAKRLGTAFSLERSFNYDTNPELYEVRETPGGYAMHFYTGKDVFNDDVVDAVMLIDGVREYNVYFDECLYLPNVELLPALFNTYYLIPENRTLYSEDAYEADRKTVNAFGCNNSELDPLFQRGSVKLVEGRHIRRDDEAVALISTWLAEHNDLKIGDYIHVEDLQLFCDNSGTLDDVLWEEDLKIVGLFSVISSQEIPERSVECNLAENFVFFDAKSAQQWNISTFAYVNGFNVEDLDEKKVPYYRVDFFVDDPAKLNQIMKEINTSELFESDFYKTTIANPSFKASVAPLKRLQGIGLVFIIVSLLVMTTAFVLIMRNQLFERQMEIAIQNAFGVEKHLILGQILMELLVILVISAVLAIPFAIKTANWIGNSLYQNTGSETIIETEDGPVRSIAVERGPNDCFLDTPSYALERIEVKTDVLSIVIPIIGGGALILGSAVIMVSLMFRKEPRILMFKE